MPRQKAAKNCKILPWMTAKPDCRDERFIQLGNSWMLSKNVHALKHTSRWTLEAMFMESGGRSTVRFTHGAAKKYGISSSTYDRTVLELVDKGFIERIEDPNRAQYAPNTFLLTIAWRTKTAHQSGDTLRRNIPQTGVGSKEK